MPMSSSLSPGQTEDRAGRIYLYVKILFVETYVNSPAVPFPIEAPEAAPTAEITAAIGLCPSGALKYVLDGQADAPAAEAGGQPTTSIVASRGGPLLVQGLFTLLDEEGKEIPVAERAALCRCGGTANAPFCDGTHRAIGFTPRRKADS